MTRLAWFGCPAGIAGDMALGALLDLDQDGSHGVAGAVAAAFASLPVEGLALRAEPVLRGSMASTKAHVLAPHDHHVHDDVHEHHHEPHRGLDDVLAVLDAADPPLAPRVRERAAAIFTALGEVEAELHGVTVDEVHFHEVGAMDAIADIVGTCAALEALGIDEVGCGPVAVGMGAVRAAHGLLPNPSPASIALLASRGAPTIGRDVTVELTTPTGAAILAALVSTFGALPAMAVEGVGYGAGTREIEGLPNNVQVVVGTALRAAAPAVAWPGAAPVEAEPLVVLEANVDDATGEVLAHAVSRLLAAGALDAWLVPITMKKGRPASMVCALVQPDDVASLAAVLATETGSLGVRSSKVERWAAARELVTVDVDGHAVRVKRSPGRDKAEADDAVAAAAALGLPLREVQRRAEDAVRSRD